MTKLADLLLSPLLLLVFLNQNVRIVLIVVKVIELHGASFEWIRFIQFLFFKFSWLVWHDDTFFQEVSRSHDRIRVQLTIILDLLDTLVIFLCVHLGTDVWITRAGLNRVA